MHAGNPLHPAFKGHLCSVVCGPGFEVAGCPQLAEHLPTDTARLRPAFRFPRFVGAAVRVALQLYILLLLLPQLRSHITHQLSPLRRSQLANQCVQPVIQLFQLSHDALTSAHHGWPGRPAPPLPQPLPHYHGA